MKMSYLPTSFTYTKTHYEIHPQTESETAENPIDLCPLTHSS